MKSIYSNEPPKPKQGLILNSIKIMGNNKDISLKGLSLKGVVLVA